MKLYGFVLSPYTQRVLIAARIKGHEIPVEGPPGGALTSAAFAAISPMRRIPVFEDADGWRISESAAIVTYLDETLPGPPLLPAEPRARALARQVTGLGDTEIGAGIRHLMVQNVFCSASNKGQLDYGREQLAQGLAALQRIGVGRWAWAAGKEPGIADAVLIPQLALVELIEMHFDGGKLLKPYPAILDYWARAQVSPIGARCVAEMGALVPIVMERRAKATA